MCARHDLRIGSYLMEMEPLPAPLPGAFLVYVTISDTSDGDVEWRGCLRFFDGPDWAVSVEGGRPLHLDPIDSEVESQ